MDIFVSGLCILILVCAALYFYGRSALPTITDDSFRKFQRSYLIVYMLAMAGDWLQGPYVYALYSHYNMSTHDIEILFVMGFGSSMIFGTFIGSFADKFGRKANCILYAILYCLSCITKHFNNFTILLIGRWLGGVATSILYSAFESWVICEHHKRGFDPSLLGSIFSHAVLGNSIVAICSGLVAQQAANFFGYVAPFDVSLVVLCVMGVVIYLTWTENHGDASATTTQSFKVAVNTIKMDPKVLCLGLIQSLFEGSMYTFVLEWTPALTSTDLTIPHGYIFAAFMVSMMIGSSIFDILRRNLEVESFMRPILFISACSLLMPIFFPGNQLVIFSGFLTFEMCIGIFWPSMSIMRDKYVPETARATIMNIFRVPLNLIVIVILSQNFKMKTIFYCCVVFLLFSTICQHWLFKMSKKLLPKISEIESKVEATELHENLIIQK